MWVGMRSRALRDHPPVSLWDFLMRWGSLARGSCLG